MSTGKNDTIALVASFLVTAGLVGAGLWFFRHLLPGSQQTPMPTSIGQMDPNQAGSGSISTTPNPTQNPGVLKLDTSLPNPSVLTMDGSVTIVSIIKQLQIAYGLVNPSLPTTYGIPDGRPNGTNAGIQNLINDSVWIAASSRPLKSEELQKGLQGIPIARDALAIAVGVNNPYKGDLTMQQLKDIFQGKITNWSEVGGPDQAIKVYNRSRDSGTYTFFQDVVLLGQSFAPDGPNFITARQDETTPLLRALGRDGITYSTITQIANQKTIRLVLVDGISPTDQDAVKQGRYPISRVVYLAVKTRTAPAVQQFIETALSPRGQQAVQRTGFIPIQ